MKNETNVIGEEVIHIIAISFFNQMRVLPSLAQMVLPAPTEHVYVERRAPDAQQLCHYVP